MSFERLLGHLAAAVNRPALASESRNPCVLVIDGLKIRLRELSPAPEACIEADVGDAGELSWSTARSMLAANFRGGHAWDAVFHMNADGTRRLSMRLALDSLSCEDFVEAVERFVSHLEDYNRRRASSVSSETSDLPVWTMA